MKTTAKMREVFQKRHKDLTGIKFGRLTPVKFTHRKVNGKKAAFWKCKCDCGNTSYTRPWTLTDGRSKSCGCWAKEKNQKQEGVSAFNTWFLSTRSYAIKRSKLVWKLSKEQVLDLVKRNCHYCGSPPCRKLYKTKCANGTMITNGIDRQDNNLGYIPSNCVPCCWNCNASKRNLPINEWMNWIARLVKFHREFI